MFWEFIDVKLSDGKEMWFFEFFVFFCINQYVIKVVCIYCLFYFEVYFIFIKVFFEDFLLYFESIVLVIEILLIIGDFNFYVDCLLYRNVKCFLEFLDIFGLI